MNNAARIERMRELLEQSFHPVSLEIEDQSHLHAGHAGAKDGRGHFRVSIVSAAFEGMNPIARHRAIYDVMGDLMKTDIHALSIDALASSEL